MEELDRRLVEFSLRLIGALLIVAVGWVGLRFLIGPVRRWMERSRLDASVAAFLANSLRSLIIVAIVLGVLQQFGVPTASLLTLLGAIGLAVALSMQGSLANFASGLLVLSFRMVRVGDLVEIGDIRGRVTDLLPFHVVLVTLDNQRVTIPNTVLTNGPVRNHSALPTRRVQWMLPLAPGDYVVAVKEAIRARLRADSRILAEPAPQLFVQEWAAEKRGLTVLAWTRTEDAVAVQQDLLEELGSDVEKSRPRPD
jgi:small conductance mechanosensitive channel